MTDAGTIIFLADNVACAAVLLLVAWRGRHAGALLLSAFPIACLVFWLVRSV